MMKLRDWVITVLAVSLLLTTYGCSASSPPDGTRNKLDYADLVSGSYRPNNPLDSGYFLPVGKSLPALDGFEGTLTISPNALEINSYVGDYYPIGFPAITVSFFTYEDYLVPVERGIIKGKYGEWGVIVDPGKVWSEPTDQGMSRASFPFILLIPDPNYPRCHNGIATFLYDETQVSSLFIQVVQETNPDLKFDMWGSVKINYAPGLLPEKEQVQAHFMRELEQQLEFHPWSEFEKQYGAKLTRLFNHGVAQKEVSAAGLVMDDIIYLQPPMTRYGEYPFPSYIRSHVYSVSKSIGNGIAMLHLAQKYGDAVFDLKIRDYLDVTADHDGWDEVTFGDVLNMAVGVGNGSHERAPLDIYANAEQDGSPFYLAQTTQDKLKVTFSSENHPWGPGEITRYINAHAFVLSAAMDAYLKSQEGPEAHLWDLLNEEVFEPIGVYHLPMLHTVERDGSQGTPMMLLGAYPTVGDIVKISMLLQNGGNHDGQQLLSATKLQAALFKTDVFRLPTGIQFDDGNQSYYMSFWGYPYRTRDGIYFQIPYMTGSGCNTVLLVPNGISIFRFMDVDTCDIELLIQVAEYIREFPGGSNDPIW